MSYSGVPLGIYAHVHFSKTELTMDEQKYIIKMHLYLDRMEDTESSLLVEHIYLSPYIFLTRNYASNHRSRTVVQTT